jgi:TetR/AcrR family transcriptional regulator, transcriptional repressor for nem operon
MARTKSFDEDVVLDQAAALFWERGYEATSVSDLETHLGLGRQSLYNTFGDKHGLFLKALERYRRRLGDPGLSALNAPGAGLGAIRKFFRWSVDMLTAAGPRRGCMVANTILERGNQDADALVQCNHSRDVLERAFRRALTQAKADGEVRRNLDVDAAATMLLTLHYGLTVLAKTGVRAREMQATVAVGLAGLA